MMKPEAQRRKQRNRERIECPVHSYQRHGKEAQELRKGIERIMMTIWNAEDFDHEDAVDALRDTRRNLLNLLEEVDARDSLAYLERCDEDVKRRSNTAKTEEGR